MSVSMVLKFSESVHGRFEHLLKAKCLVRDICKNKHKAKKQVQKHKTRTQT